MKSAVKILFLGLCICFSLSAFGGGEVPWPLTSQRALSAENSEGIWYAEINGVRGLYNVEIIQSSELWLWVRVSVLDYRTLNVLYQGEGYYRYKKPMFSIDADENDGSEEEGAFVFLAPIVRGGSGFFLRIIELWGRFDSKLGLSMFPEDTPKDGYSGIGFRIAKTPLSCQPNFASIFDEDEGSFVAFKRVVECRFSRRVARGGSAVWDRLEPYITNSEE